MLDSGPLGQAQRLGQRRSHQVGGRHAEGMCTLAERSLQAAQIDADAVT
jgi:hypothetical protein